MIDKFGHSVAVSGDTAVIGARLDDAMGSTSGSAYVFEKIGGVWTQTAKLTADDGAAADRFGYSVGVSGDIAVIGARLDDDLGAQSGSAYVFEKVAGVWIQTAKLTADDGAAGAQFGLSAAGSGVTVLIGSGVSRFVYVFEKFAGVWTQTSKLVAAGGTAFDGFGNSVALAGDTAVIGAGRDNDLGDSSGSAYIFEKTGGVWTQTAKLNAADGGTLDGFGNSVGISGNTAIIGASSGDDACPGNLFCNSGSAYVFGVTDCNGNGIPDECDMANGTSQDVDGDGIPDECVVIPTASAWGLIVVTLLLLAGMTIKFAARRPERA